MSTELAITDMSFPDPPMPHSVPCVEFGPIPSPRLAPDANRQLAEAARALGSIPDQGEAEEQLADLLRRFPKQRELIRQVLTIAEAVRGIEVFEAIEEAAQERAENIIRNANAKVEPIRLEAEQIRAKAHAEARQQAAQLMELKAEVQREREALVSPHAESLALLDAWLERMGYGQRRYDGEREQVPSNVAMHATTYVASMCGKNPVHIEMSNTPAQKGRL